MSKKTEEELLYQAKMVEQKALLKLQRNKEQEKNISRKSADASEPSEYKYEHNSQDGEEDDIDWYKKEVGIDPDPETRDILKARTSKGKDFHGGQKRKRVDPDEQKTRKISEGNSKKQRKS